MEVSPCPRKAVGMAPGATPSGRSGFRSSSDLALTPSRWLCLLAPGGYLDLMSEVTRMLSDIEAGDPHAAADLLPFVYDELRRLAGARMAGEKPGQTMDATALVHEAYLRLVGPADERRWQNRGHFFAAAAEAMRRILVENARRKKRLRHGGGLRRAELPADGPP